jgi:hypothetical protein
MTSYLRRRYSQRAMNGLRPDTAFLVQFRTNSDPATDKLTGRIEHVSSGKTETFESLKDVPKLLRRMLKDSRRIDSGGL